MKIADIIDIYVFSGNISYIPYILAIISYRYIVFVALLPSLTLGNRVNKWGKLFLFFGILLLPMGTTATEIIGKTLQFHFYTWIVAFCLLIYRYDNKNTKKISILLSDLLVLACIESFPIVLILVFIYALFELKDIVKKYFMNGRTFINNLRESITCELHKFSFKQMMVFFIIVGVLGIRLILKMKGYESPEPLHGTLDNIVEFLVRGISYIFIWPFYGKLNNVSGVIVLLLTCLFYIFGYIYINRESRKTYLISLGSFIIITLITVSTRFFLTRHLYQFTYQTVPDRYYILMNFTSMFPVAIIISDGLKRNSRKMIKLLGAVLIIYFGVIFVINRNFIFQGKENRMPWLTNITFRERLNNSYASNRLSEDGKDYVVTIDPEWTMLVPRDRMEKSVNR